MNLRSVILSLPPVVFNKCTACLFLGIFACYFSLSLTRSLLADLSTLLLLLLVLWPSKHIYHPCQPASCLSRWQSPGESYESLDATEWSCISMKQLRKDSRQQWSLNTGYEWRCPNETDVIYMTQFLIFYTRTEWSIKRGRDTRN